MAVKTTAVSRERRHQRVRKKVNGTPERPRVSVYRSLKHIYAQIIDDMSRATLVAASSMDKEFSGHGGSRGNRETAKLVGGFLAKRAVQKGIKKVVFDRGGYRFHGRIKELAEAAREGGLEF